METTKTEFLFPPASFIARARSSLKRGLYQSVSRPWYWSLTPIIFMLCVLGVFATTDRMFDTWIMLILGLGGYLLRKLNYPVAPAVLAIVLGPLAERSMRQSLISSQGDITTFVTRPISLTCVLLALLLVSYPLIQRVIRRRKAAARAG